MHITTLLLLHILSPWSHIVVQSTQPVACVTLKIDWYPLGISE